MPSSSLIVPPCPAGVAFHKEDFLHEGFNVDGFLARYAGNYGLDSLRDDLGMYLQVRTYRLWVYFDFVESTRLKSEKDFSLKGCTMNDKSTDCRIETDAQWVPE